MNHLFSYLLFLIVMTVFSSYAEQGAVAEKSSRTAPSVSADSSDSSATDGEEAVSASPAPTVNYGQIFIEESRSEDYFPIGISLFAGQEISSPYVFSHLMGGEVSWRIHPLLHFGLEYSFYDSTVSSAMSSLSKELELYGMDIGYPFLESTVYFNYHYTLFIGHINMAGLSNLKMDFPVHLGLGVMNMEKGEHLFAVKWGAGPQIYITPRWGLQLRLSQIISMEETQFLYTYCSFSIMYNL